MRTLLAIVGVLIGLILLAAPTLAHATHNAPTDKPVVAAEKATPTGPRICLFSQNGLRAEPAPDKTSDDLHEPPHEADPAHDPDDHSHPLGEDTHHQKASHGAADVAHDQRQAEVKRDGPQQPPAPQPTDKVCGIDVTPPVPPPLG